MPKELSEKELDNAVREMMGLQPVSTNETPKKPEKVADPATDSAKSTLDSIMTLIM